MMEKQKNLNFSDFQRMLEENEGKPVYKKEKDKYVLEWSIGGFTYQTEVKFSQIHESYKKQFGREDNKLAIEVFFEKYLKDAYENISGFKDEEIELIDAQTSVRNQEEEPESKWKYQPVTQIKEIIRKSTWLESDKNGGYIIKALNNKNAVITVGEVKRVDGRLMSSVDDPKNIDTQLRREKIDVQKSDRDSKELYPSKHKTK